jgi:hypothetical protein
MRFAETIVFVPVVLVSLGCASVSGPPAHPAKVISALCATDSFKPGSAATLRFHITNSADTALDICMEQVAAYLRSPDGGYVRPLAARTTFDAACPERTHLPLGGHAVVALPIRISNDAPLDAHIEGVLGIKWPPEMRTTPANARFELQVTCGKAPDSDLPSNSGAGADFGPRAGRILQEH